MVLSVEKTIYITVSLKNNAISFRHVTYTFTDCLGKQGLGMCVCNKCSIDEMTNYIKYLGIVLDNELKWKTHTVLLKLRQN